MDERVRIELEPLGERLAAPRGTALRDLLHAYGVEFPCGGRGRCRGCRVRVLEGVLPTTAEEERILTREEINRGWRLACRARVPGDLTLDVAQWEMAILAEHRSLPFRPCPGRGIAVDLGTTTLVAQLLDLGTGRVLGVRTGRNPQAVHGADLVSRIAFAADPKGRALLVEAIRRDVGRMVAELLPAGGEVARIVVAGNTAMHHFLADLDPAPLARAPFELEHGGLAALPAAALGWEVPGNPVVEVLPCVGGFVGGDLLAGILATQMAESEELIALLDLGTNGEIAVGSRDRILCASTAAGPAFEGGRIGMGMQAASGAIDGVTIEDGELCCHVVGGGAARGICGSGLVDAVASALELGWVEPSGRLGEGRQSIPLTPAVRLSQADIRELQLAKAAVAAGARILLARLGAGVGELAQLFLAGAFGNYVRPASARRIGLVACDPERIEAAGNTALLGAKLMLFRERAEAACAEVLAKVEHVSLAADRDFQRIFLEETRFPEG